MKRIVLLAVLSVFSAQLLAQKKPIPEIEKLVTRNEVEPPLSFLAADEMRGRDTGSKELDIAANYIASTFQQIGLKQVEGAPKYFQPVDLVKTEPFSAGDLKLGADNFLLKEHFVVLEGVSTDWTGEFIYVGYGGEGEIPADVKGKMVVSLAGKQGAKGVNEIFLSSQEKLSRVKAAGAAGLVEYFVTVPFPWPALVNYFGSTPKVAINSGAALPHLWMKDSELPGMKELKDAKKVNGSLKLVAGKQTVIPSKNVVGKIEGTDPKLKGEYLVVSAHYDHVGVGPKKNQDSIYNGARDNALGTVGMLTAAKFFAKFPPKRSVLFMALTGEEKGLLGSAWYAEHPLVPLEKTIFDLDCDGAGYNDTTVTTIIGLERTSVEADMVKACSAFGLKAIKDPVPQENLYERSDNYNFAKKGIPAIDFAPGVTAFDAEIMKYYHQPADETGSLSYGYLVKFYRSFVYANYLIANGAKTPAWVAGDKFEAIGNALYKK
jgi:hypothetical protein